MAKAIKTARILSVLLILCLSLSGCGGKTDVAEEHLRMLEGKNISALVQARLTAGGVVSTYTLALRLQDGETEITVREPEAHAGITVRLDSGGTELSYGETQLVIPGGEGTLSLFSLLSGVARSLTGGSAEIFGRERREDMDVIVLYMQEDLGGNAVNHRISLSAESGLPVFSESSAEGDVTLSCRWEECEIKEG